MLTKIISRIRSSKLFSQRNFEVASESSPGGAHFRGAVFAVMTATLTALPLLAVTSPQYRNARSLLDDGVTMRGVVDRVDRRSEIGGKGGKVQVTTIDYQFRLAGGQVKRGHSTVREKKSTPVATGDTIEIMHDPHRPDHSGWTVALRSEVAGAFGVVVASLLILPWCGLSVYRYVRWMCARRRRSPLNHAADRI